MGSEDTGCWVKIEGIAMLTESTISYRIRIGIEGMVSGDQSSSGSNESEEKKRGVRAPGNREPHSGESNVPCVELTIRSDGVVRGVCVFHNLQGSC